MTPREQQDLKKEIYRAVSDIVDNKLKKDLVVMKDEIGKAIQISVNGKIDKMQKGLDIHNEKHENDMARMLPVIEAFETSQRFAQDAKSSGRVILYIAGFITAVGAAWLMLRAVFHF